MPVQNGAPPEIGSDVTVEAMNAAPVGAQIQHGGVGRIYTKEADERWHKDQEGGRRRLSYPTDQFDNGRGRASGYRWHTYPTETPRVGGRPTVAQMQAAPVGAKVLNANSGYRFTKQANGQWANDRNGAEHSSQAFRLRLDDYTWVTYPQRLEDLPQVRVLNGANIPHSLGGGVGWVPRTFHYLECGSADEVAHYRLVVPAGMAGAGGFTAHDPEARRWVQVNMPNVRLKQWWVRKVDCEPVNVVPQMGATPTLTEMEAAPTGSKVRRTDNGRVRTKMEDGRWACRDKPATHPRELVLRRYEWVEWGKEKPKPRPHLASTLWLISMEDTYSIYETPEGGEVWLRHTDGAEVTEFARLDFDKERREWEATKGVYDPTGFINLLRTKVVDPDVVTASVLTCGECSRSHLREASTEVVGGAMICTACIGDYSPCTVCNQMDSELVDTEDGQSVCRTCRRDYLHCGRCAVWYHPDAEGHRHDGSDCCKSPAESFTIRNDGKDPLPENTRVVVGLGAGTLSSEGVAEIARGIVKWVKYNPDEVGNWRDSLSDGYKIWECTNYLSELGEKWQTKEGNYPKRFSRLAYKRHKIKVPPGLISEIGNIGALHSKGADYHVETTRYFDGRPAEYAQAGSCWWQSYWHCRCMLKSNGGFGIRTFAGADSTEVVGRAWAMPLRLTADVLTPTFDTMSPDAFIVFNGYGNLVQYTAPRILAHMAGMSYKALDLGIECVDKAMYLNAGSGYIVAPEEIIAAHPMLRLRLEQHANLFENEKEKVA